MRTATRWTVAGLTAAGVLAATVAVPAIASADPDLPPTTAAELLTDLGSAEQRPFSGTVVHTTDLGLPQLPQGGESSSADLTNLLSGSTTLRLWSAGPDTGRVAVVGAFAETDLVRNGTDAWVWRSDDKTAVHATLPEDAKDPAASGSDTVAGAAGTPQQAADQVLQALDPTTEVTLGEETKVAGRDAYQLVLEPKAADSLVGEVRMAVDAQTQYPLRVQVFAKGASAPALETSFTSISYDTPDASVFSFSPPKGTEVTEAPSAEALAASMAGGPGAGKAPEGALQGNFPAGGPQGAGAEPTVIGEGWGSVAVVRGASGALDQLGGGSGEAAGVGQALEGAFRPVSGAYGSGKVFTSSLVSVMALDDGRVLVGAVPPSVLEAAALDPTAAP